MRKLPFAFGALVLMGIFAACGSDGDDDLIPSNPDGGEAGTSGSSASGASGNASSGASGTTSTSGASGTSGTTSGSTSGTTSSSGDAGKDGGDAGPIVPGDSCRAAGVACASPTECCTGACVSGQCSATQCVPDKPTAGACTQNGQCCSGVCTGGKCASLDTGGSCRTAGNPCAVHGDCCSKLCNGGFCSTAVSFCTQVNDVCGSNTECCSGNCVKQGANITGLCGDAPSGGGVPAGCEVAGTVCGGSAGGTVPDGGTLPPCDQNCCSRACGYAGAFPGFRVCQQPSGCHPTGELCRASSDCCGWNPSGGDVECAKKNSNDEFGRCDNGNSCREPGSICKPGGNDSCSAENNCCEPKGAPDAGIGSSYCNKDSNNCCKKDSLGIPRCLLNAIDCKSNPPPAGATCATSADCCGNACIDGKCLGSGGCQKRGNTCTNTADCCTGLPCVQAPGSATGLCGGTLLPDGGVTPDAGSSSSSSSSGGSSGGSCALYGQLCSGNGDCCNGVPCTSGRCRLP